MKHIQGFSKRYQDLPLITEGPWYETAKRVHSSLKAGGIVVLFGHRGTGKSFMAWDIANHGKFPDPRDGEGDFRPIINRTAMELFMEIRDTWRKGSEVSELELIREWTDAALLVIDEIQERGETAFENQKLTAIIDARYRAMRPTLLIGNYDNPSDMAASLGPSVISRIQENGGAIHCNWPSFRSNPR